MITLEEGVVFYATACAIFLLAGTIKGAIGIGLPTTAMSLMLLFFDPKTAMALVILPIVFTNGQQYFSTPDKRQTMRKYGIFAGVAIVTIFIVSAFAVNLTVDYLRLFIAITILIFCATQIFKLKLSWVGQYDRFAQAFFGLIAGICGGLTSIWAPPILIYTISKDVKKEEFIAAAGFLIFVTSLPLLAGLLFAGIVDFILLPAALSSVLTAVLGFKIGALLRKFINEKMFRFILLGFFMIAGLRLLISELTKF